MKIIKGVLTYTLILIGVLVISGLILIGAMTFLKIPIFGYNFIIGGDEYEYTSSFATFATPATTDTWTIVVNSNNYDIKIRAYGSTASTNMTPYVSVSNDAFGLVENGYREAGLSLTYGEDGTAFGNDRASSKYMTITVNAPQGILNYQDSYIAINLPYVNFAYDLVLNSGSGDIELYTFYNTTTQSEEEGNLHINSLKLITTSGNFTMDGMYEEANTTTIDYRDSVNYDPVTTEAERNAYKEANEDVYVDYPEYRTINEVQLTSLIIESERGTFDFRNQNLNLDGASVKIKSERGNFYFNEIKSGFNITGENLFFIASSIYTNGKLFLFNCPNGTLDIGRIDVGSNLAEIVTEYAKVDIDNLYGDISIQATYGSTNILNTYSNVVDITTTHGDISILNVVNRAYRLSATTTLGTAAIRSTYGDIKVSNYYANGWFTNKNGQINVTYKGTAVNETIIRTVDGYVNADGLKGIVDAKATGSANITLTYARIPLVTTAEDTAGDYYASVNTGKLTINIPVAITTAVAPDNYTSSFGFAVDGHFSNESKLLVNTGSVNVFTSTENPVDYTTFSYGNYVTFNITSTGGDAIINLI